MKERKKERISSFIAFAIIALFALAHPVIISADPGYIEKITLENGAYAIYRFDLPAGQTWGNYSKITVDYMIDAVNLRKQQRNGHDVRLMGNYRENNFTGRRVRNFELNDSNAPYIIDNAPKTFASMGASANQWFTVEYNITGSAGHAQLNRNNIPAANSTGPFYFGVGIPSQGEGTRIGITQFVRNVTLHHSSDPALNVVSTGSGFSEPAFVSWNPVNSTREKVTSAP